MVTFYLVTFLHVLVCVFLILVVLLQSGKGADLAGAFGGGATQTAFGSRGPASFLSKLTTGAAVVFMLTCLSLSLLGSKPEERSVLETTKGGAAAPAKSAPAGKAAGTQAAPSPEQIRKMQEEAEAKQRQGATAAQPATSTTAPAPSASAPAEAPAKAPEAPSKK